MLGCMSPFALRDSKEQYVHGKQRFKNPFFLYFFKFTNFTFRHIILVKFEFSVETMPFCIECYNNNTFMEGGGIRKNRFGRVYL